MSLRQLLNNNSSIVTLASLVVLILALGWMVQTSMLNRYNSADVPNAWFYDLNTGELFEAKSNAIPPIDAPSGNLPNGEPAGVRAKVFACGDRSDPAKQFVGWLEKLTPEAKQAIVQGQTGEGMSSSSSSIGYLEGLLVRSADGDRWVSANSREAMRLFQSPRDRCPKGEVLSPCFPSHR